MTRSRKHVDDTAYELATRPWGSSPEHVFLRLCVVHLAGIRDLLEDLHELNVKSREDLKTVMRSQGHKTCDD